MTPKIKTIATLAAAILAAGATQLRAQTPCTGMKLDEMTFVRQNFARNFYNSNIPASRLNMDGPELFLKNSANLIVEGSVPEQEGQSLRFADNCGTSVRVASFHPYFCYEADFRDIPSDGRAGIVFYANDGSSRITVYRCGNALKAEKDGKEICSNECASAADFTMRIQYTGARFHIFTCEGAAAESGSGEAGLNSRMSRPVASVSCDMRRMDAPVKWSWGIRAEGCAGGALTRAESCLSCGTGQADPQIVQNADGTPLVIDGRLYICMTTRGFEQIPDSYQGVYSLGLSGFDLRLEGALFFTEGDGRMLGYHATKVVRDGDRYLVMTTTHGGKLHTLAYAETGADILHGIHYLECRNLEFPHKEAEGTKYGTEDPDFFYDAKARRWRLAYCARQGSNKDGQHLSYVTHLCESKNWDGPYKLIATSKEDNNTGIRITTVGGKRYVLSGGSDTTFYIYDYPGLECLGTFRQEFPNGGFRGWPTIVPLQCGNYERYLWITFDRGAQTGKYSYGTLYFYLGDKMWLNRR